MADKYPPDNPNQGKDPNQPNPQAGNQAGPNYTPPNRGDSTPGGGLGENTMAVERRYGLSLSEEDRKKSFEIEDERWSRENQIKDWLKLGGMVLITVIWTLLVYFLEPGLR